MQTLKALFSPAITASIRGHSRTALLFLFFLASCRVEGQSVLGIGIGSENLHIGGGKPRNWAPHIYYEYVTSSMRSGLYFEATGFKRSYSNNSNYLDPQGQPIPYRESFEYWHILLQGGFKVLLSGDVDKKAPVFFLGAGLADCISIMHYRAEGTDPQHPLSSSDKGTTNSFGLGFLAGVQYYLRPIIIELKGNLDFLLKQVSEYGGNTNVHTDARLTILFPLHSFQ